MLSDSSNIVYLGAYKNAFLCFGFATMHVQLKMIHVARICLIPSIDIPTLNVLFQVGLWIFGSTLKVDAVTAAILGLSVLLITGVVTWKECLGEAVAWDTLTWFAALIAMAGYLNKYGLISWFSETVVKVCFHCLIALRDILFAFSLNVQ